MFSGKTSSLEKDVKRFKIAGYKTLAFKPTVDTRYATSDIISHDYFLITTDELHKKDNFQHNYNKDNYSFIK